MGKLRSSTSEHPEIQPNPEIPTEPKLNQEPNPEPNPGPQPEAKPESLNPFRPENLALSQAFTAELNVKPFLRIIRVGKPDPQNWIRVNPDLHENFAILTMKRDREEYIVHPSLVQALSKELTHKTAHLCVDAQRNPFFWLIPLPRPDGRDNIWHKSARLAIEDGRNGWIRVYADLEAGMYKTEGLPPGSVMPQPEWPQGDLWTLIGIAFRDFLIQDLDHPVIKKLRGVMP